MSDVHGVVDRADAAANGDLDKVAEMQVAAMPADELVKSGSASTSSAAAAAGAVVAAGTADDTDATGATHTIVQRMDKETLLRAGFSTVPCSVTTGGAASKSSLAAAVVMARLKAAAQISILEKGYNECTAQELCLKVCPNSGTSTLVVPEVKTTSIFPFWGNLHFAEAKKTCDVRFKVSNYNGYNLWLAPDREYPCTAWAAHVATDSDEATFEFTETILEVDIGLEDAHVTTFFHTHRAAAATTAARTKATKRQAAGATGSRGHKRRKGAQAALAEEAAQAAPETTQDTNEVDAVDAEATATSNGAVDAVDAVDAVAAEVVVGRGGLMKRESSGATWRLCLPRLAFVHDRLYFKTSV